MEIKLLDINNDWQQVRPSLKFIDGMYRFSGYQSFNIDENIVIPVSENTKLKYSLVKKTIHFDTKSKTVIDLGCSNMFFGYLSRSNGADSVIGVDLDNDYLKLNNELIDLLGFKNIKCEKSNAAEFSGKANTVFAFAIIHWIYSCSGFLGSLKNVVYHLRSLTNNCLYVEWICPTDDCIAGFHHLSYNSNLSENDYNKTNFLSYLNNNFNKVEYLGRSKNTREIYRCEV